jgi:hypothetical protein
VRASGGRNVGAEAAQGPSSTAVGDQTCSALIDGVLGESSPNRKLLVKHQPAKSVNPAARRFGNSAFPRPQIEVNIRQSHISPKTSAATWRPNFDLVVLPTQRIMPQKLSFVTPDTPVPPIRA